MKYFKTFEAYVTYNDLKRSSSDIENELRGELIKLFIYGGISDHIDDLIYTDQSTDKGIKWQIEVKGKGSDTIHAYKDGKWISQYEWYLNKKKSSKHEIQQYFLNKYLAPLDLYLTYLKSYDSTYMYSDDSRAVNVGAAQAKNLRDLYAKLSSSDKKKAMNAYADMFKAQIEPKSFNGVA